MSPASSRPDAPLDRLLADRYRIEGELARGGMAVVYRATDERLGRPVAVKVLAAPYADDPRAVERFLAEARTAASISHPNLAHVYDSGSDAGWHFMVIELLERHRSLREELQAGGPLPPARAAEIGLEVLAGLEPLHDHGIVHCDVKPGNVMIGGDGAKLIDFGIARSLDAPGGGATSIGSLHAMSPEQLRGEQLTPSSDLFSVGVLLYEALTGRVPFPGSTANEVVEAQDRGTRPPSSLVDGIGAVLDDVVVQALRLEPRRRFASAGAMATALRTALEAQRAETALPRGGDDTTAVHLAVPPPVAASAAPAPRPAPPPTRRPAAPRRARNRGSWALAGLAGAGVLGLVTAVVLLGSPDGNGRGGSSPSSRPTATPIAEPTLAPGMVRVPDTIGMSEAEAQAVAEAAGLAWRIEWRRVPGRPPGIYRQDPDPGEIVREGSPFVMQAYRQR
jgi:serine/threonine-protein kinase